MRLQYFLQYGNDHRLLWPSGQNTARAHSSGDLKAICYSLFLINVISHNPVAMLKFWWCV